MGKDQAVVINIRWAGDNLQVQGSADNATVIAVLEMAKALMMRKTLGPEILLTMRSSLQGAAAIAKNRIYQIQGKA